MTITNNKKLKDNNTLSPDNRTLFINVFLSVVSGNERLFVKLFFVVC